MKNVLFAAAIAMSFAAQAHAAPLYTNAGLTDVVTFGEASVKHGEAMTSQFSAQGVHFTTSGPGAWYAAVNGVYRNNTNFSGNYLDSFSGGGEAAVYSILFDNVTAGAGAWFEFNSNTNATFTSYLNGLAQDSFVYTNAACCNSAQFLGFSGRFDEIRMSTITGRDFVMDNLAFTPAEVPEPASIALFGLSLLAMARIKRRRG